MEKIKSIFITNDMIPTAQEIDKIRWREHKSFSQITCMAWKEYVENHKDGNDTYTLDLFDTDAMSACPAFYRPLDVWKSYMEKINDNQQKKFSKQIQSLEFIKNSLKTKNEKKEEQTLESMGLKCDELLMLISREERRAADKAVDKKMRKLLSNTKIDFSLYPVMVAKNEMQEVRC